MFNYLKELLFGPDYKEIIRQKNTQIFNLAQDRFKYELQIDELIRKLSYYQGEQSYTNNCIAKQNKQLREELEAIKQADKTLLEALCLKENTELKQRIKELEDTIQSTKDYYKNISV